MSIIDKTSLQRYRLQSHALISVLEGIPRKKNNGDSTLDCYYTRKKKSRSNLEMQMCQFVPKGGANRSVEFIETISRRKECALHRKKKKKEAKEQRDSDCEKYSGRTCVSEWKIRYFWVKIHDKKKRILLKKTFGSTREKIKRK